MNFNSFLYNNYSHYYNICFWHEEKYSILLIVKHHFINDCKFIQLKKLTLISTLLFLKKKYWTFFYLLIKSFHEQIPLNGEFFFSLPFAYLNRLYKNNKKARDPKRIFETHLWNVISHIAITFQTRNKLQPYK